MIVDTHSTPALALQLAEQCVGPGDAGRLLVVNTHADYDHAWGNQVFSGPEAPYPAPIIGHVLCAERLGGGDAVTSRAKMELEQPGRFDDLVLTPPNITSATTG